MPRLPAAYTSPSPLLPCHPAYALPSAAQPYTRTQPMRFSHHGPITHSAQVQHTWALYTSLCSILLQAPRAPAPPTELLPCSTYIPRGAMPLPSGTKPRTMMGALGTRCRRPPRPLNGHKGPGVRIILHRGQPAQVVGLVVVVAAEAEEPHQLRLLHLVLLAGQHILQAGGRLG